MLLINSSYVVVDCCQVTGVAELNNNIYVAVDGSNQLRVFGSILFNRRENLVVTEMESPWELTADLTYLYIADRAGQCVWRVEVKGEEDSDAKEKIKVDKFVFEGHPWSLSVTETGQVHVVDWGEDELTICSGQGERLEVIKLNDKGLSGTVHVMQTSPETFLVVHNDLVSLVNRKWKVLKQYGGSAAPVRLSAPRRLVEVSADGHKFVVDEERVLVFSPCLKLERTLVLCPSESENLRLGWLPRLYYSKSSGRLIVYWGGEYVWIYSVTSETLTSIN